MMDLPILHAVPWSRERSVEWRPTSSGIAVIGGTLWSKGTGEFATPPIDAVVLNGESLYLGEWNDVRAQFNFTERWRLVDGATRWHLRRQNGPLTFHTTSHKCFLRCVCGWMGPVRSYSARRFVMRDQHEHVCVGAVRYIYIDKEVRS